MLQIIYKDKNCHLKKEEKNHPFEFSLLYTVQKMSEAKGYVSTNLIKGDPPIVRDSSITN